MKTKTITDPRSMDSTDLLGMIEHDDDTFTTGRRNNDLVNWFIAKRLVDLDKGEPFGRSANDMYDVYTDDFGVLMKGMTDAQLDSLDLWDENWESKILTLCTHYHGFRDVHLRNIWLPMDYTVQTVNEDQLQLI